MADPEKQLAVRILAERKRRGWTIEQMAAALRRAGAPKASASGVYKSESGTPPRRVPLDEMLAYAQVFETSLDELVSGDVVSERFWRWYRSFLDAWEARRAAFDLLEVVLYEGAEMLDAPEIKEQIIEVVNMDLAVMKAVDQIIERSIEGSPLAEEWAEIRKEKGARS